MRPVRQVRHAGRVQRRVASAQRRLDRAGQSDGRRFPTESTDSERTTPTVRPRVRPADTSPDGVPADEPEPAGESQIVIHHNDGQQTEHTTTDSDELAAWEAEAQRQAEAGDIRAYDVHRPDGQPLELATVTPITGGDMSVDTSVPAGEITNYTDAVQFCHRMHQALAKLAAVGQDSMESLAAFGLSGPLMEQITAGCEQTGGAAEAYGHARDEFATKHGATAEAVSDLGDDAANDIAFYKQA
jgi:hypothetical protein